MVRIVSVLLAVMLAGNGVVMLFAGLWWYGVVPGVTATGPYNPHFVRDIGAAYIVAGGALGAYAFQPRWAWSAVVGSAVFQLLHAAVHVFDAACGTSPLHDVLRDLFAIYAPAVITLLIALRKPA